MSKEQEAANHLLRRVLEKVGSQVLDSSVSQGDVTVIVGRESSHDFFQLLKLDTELDFQVLLDVTVVDWMDEREDRFEVVYHLLSPRKRSRLRVKIAVPEETAEVPTVTDLWRAANFLEREAWDMYGVDFTGHPDQRRILLYDEFEGHPLRKDYPVQAKQPRIQLRHPEVENTARDMRRPVLVNIGERRKNSGSSKSSEATT